jgi:hypothetical protein
MIFRGDILMSEVKKDSSNTAQVSESADISMAAKLDEMVTILKNIDEKMTTITRAIREINARG